LDRDERVRSAGWYFSSAQAFDLTAAHQLTPKTQYVDAVVSNLNYEGGTNPVNVSYVTGLGRKRQHEIVHQYAQNDRRDLPPGGIPLGNVQTGPVHTPTYNTELASVVFPADSAGTAPYPFYDRWTDTFNVTTEFVHVDQGRSLSSLAYLAAQSGYRSQSWRSGTATITGLPDKLAAGSRVTAGISASGVDLTNATIVWEATGQPSQFGSSYSFTPTSHGEQWVEAEATLPDGRRVVAVKNFFAENGNAYVTVVATDNVARIGTDDYAVFTFTRTGDTSAPLVVKFSLGGSAAKWTDYRRPEGDMPVEMTIPAGAASVTMSIRAMANSTNANPATVVVTVTPGSNYNAGNPASATATITN
jgi:hypothetical protein